MTRNTFAALTLLGAALLATPAFAITMDPNNQISFAGTDTYCGTTSTANCSAGTIHFSYMYPVAPGAATGIFSAFAGSTPVFSDFNYLLTTAPFTLLSDTSNGQSLTFTVTNYTHSISSGLEVSGNGYYTLTNGSTSTQVNGGNFDLTTQGATGSTVTFSDTNSLAATPEPSSLALLGTGILSVAGIMRRRFLKA